MAWDAKKADEVAAEFAQKVDDLLKNTTPEGRKALADLQALWRADYTTSGHKRLARVFVKAAI